MLNTTANTHKLKLKRDLSTICNYAGKKERKGSDLVSPSNRLDVTSTIDAYLPDINAKHRSQKRSSFLEMWLDEALDPEESTNKKG